MYRLAFYFIRQIVPWLGLCLAGLMLVFLTTQLMRVAPIFAGGGAGFGESARALGLLLIPVAGWALTPAFAVAVFAAAGRMAADGELIALDASGLDRLRMAIGPLGLALALCLPDTWVSVDLGPRSQRILRGIAVSLAARAAVGQMEEGVFFEPLEGVTFFADRRPAAGSFKGVFVEDTRNRSHPVQFVAEKGRISANISKQFLDVRLSSGAAFFSPTISNDPRLSVSFETLDLKLPLKAEIERNLDFLPGLLAVPTGSLLKPAPNSFNPDQWSYALWRRVAGPVGFLCFSLLSIALAFGLSLERRGTAVAAAAALFLAYHLLCRLTESLMQADMLSAFSAALLPSAIVFMGFVATVAKSLRKTFSRQRFLFFN
jgi:lipopolysaccharide export LptBFGC system permease protein LptF